MKNTKKTIRSKIFFFHVFYFHLLPKKINNITELQFIYEIVMFLNINSNVVID